MVTELTCLLCGAVIRVHKMHGHASYRSHVRRCERATASEREHFRRTRRWPQTQQNKTDKEENHAAR
jgi:hypothetical protein